MHPGPSRCVAAIVIALVTLLLPPTALATVHTHAEAQVQFDTPKGWKVEVSDDRVVVSDDTAAMFLQVLDAADLEAATTALDEEIGKMVKDVKWEGKPAEVKLNGMSAIVLGGAGTLDHSKVQLGVMVVSTPGKKFLLVLGMVPDAKAKKYDKTIERFLKSIKPAPKR